MKKLGIIGLFLIYAAASIGISIKQFYCCNQLKSTSLAYTAVEESSCGMSHKMKDCCKTKVKFVKSQDTHFAKSSTNNLPNFNALTALETSDLYTINLNHAAKKGVLAFHPPPLIPSVPLYQFYCNYRI